MRHTVEAIIATIVVPGTADFLVPFLILRRTGQGFPPRLGIVELFAVGLVCLGFGAVIWVSYAFVTCGRGTPVPVDPPQHLVAQGLFRCVRNPMYAGVLLVLLAEALLFRSWWILLYAAGLWAALHTFLVLLEEPQLRRRFGDAYAEYCASTPRWIPRLRRLAGPGSGG